jgi:gliding motility-associated-like protein
MFLRHYCKPYQLIFLLHLLIGYRSFSQCSPAIGPPPSNLTFNTGGNGNGGRLPSSADDLHWKVAADSITGVYNPAVVMDSLPPDYFISPWSDCRWISISNTGSHPGNRNFFYKMNFDLPCANPCGISYDSNNLFCLTLDLFADNSVYEIYVNGVAQSSNLGNIIPILPDPYHVAGLNESGMLSVSLCKNWKAGANSLVIEVASSAPVTGLLVQASTVFKKPISNFVTASICQGEVYHFGSQHLTQAGIAYETFKTTLGCDSTVALDLQIKPASAVTIDKSICAGQNFLGNTATGTYTDTLLAANGCDSIRTLHLTVTDKPQPNLGTNTVLCKGDSLLLSPGKFLSYLWQDASTLDHFFVKTPGLYSVIVTDSCGSAKGEITITERECDIYFPSAFTPNGDGKNDYFKILTAYQLQEYSLSVYNRWGQKVFETSNPLKGWDGTTNGQRQPTSVFAWKCRYKKSNVISNVNGTVMLIR